MTQGELKQKLDKSNHLDAKNFLEQGAEKMHHGVNVSYAFVGIGYWIA